MIGLLRDYPLTVTQIEAFCGDRSNIRVSQKRAIVPSGLLRTVHLEVNAWARDATVFYYNGGDPIIMAAGSIEDITTFFNDLKEVSKNDAAL